MKLILFRSNQPHHLYLQHQLSLNFELVGLVEEPSTAQIQRLRKQRQYRDYFYAIYHAKRRTFFGLNNFRKQYFRISEKTPLRQPPSMLTVSWINNDNVAELLKNTPHDAVIVIGTSIIKQVVLQATVAPIINIHGGFLPYYRGNHCFFFALYDRAFDKIGSTIHLVDSGIDTGNVIERIVPDLLQNDTPEKLYCRAEKLAIHRIVEILNEHSNGNFFKTFSQSSVGRTYRTRDRKLHHEIIFWVRNLIQERKTIPEYLCKTNNAN